MARVALNNDEIKFLVKRMAAGRTWAQAKSDLVAIAPDVDAAAGLDAGFQVGVTAQAKQYLREHAVGPDSELTTLRALVTPAPTALDVASGPQAGGTTVAVAGTGFVIGATVTVGGNPATVVSSLTNEIVIKTPAHGAGATDVVVTNPSTKFGTLAGSFTYV